jgi:membrane associated rhomboid family serine protease
MGMRMTPVVLGVLASCIAIFLLQLVAGRWLEANFALWPLETAPFSSNFQPWQLVSYAFLHGSIAHLFFNMFALYMFGPDIERLTGSRRFFTYYIVCVISAALAQLAVQRLFKGASIATVGASGGIFGLLLAFGLAFPQRRLMLIFPPIPMPAWLFVTLYGLLELYMGVSGRDPGVAHFAHLGGMVGGFALILYWRAQQRR